MLATMKRATLIVNPFASGVTEERLASVERELRRSVELTVILTERAEHPCFHLGGGQADRRAARTLRAGARDRGLGSGRVRHSRQRLSVLVCGKPPASCGAGGAFRARARPRCAAAACTSRHPSLCRL